MAGPLRIVDEPHGVRVVVLDRPPANALDDSLLDALLVAAEDATTDDDVRAVVLAADGPFFSGGFDLRAPRRDGGEIEAMVRRYRDSHRALLALPKPTVAAVQGHAIAGGLVLALACDHRIASDADYRIGLNETAIGAAFPPVAREIVRLRLTDAALSELLLGAEVLPSTELVRLGVAPRLTRAPVVRQAAVDLATRLGGYPRPVYAHAKGTLVADALERVDRCTLDEELAVAALWSTDESRAARSAQRRRLGQA